MKVKLSAPIHTISGTIDGLTFFTRNGVTYARQRPLPRTQPSTAAQISRQQRLAQTTKMVNEVMGTSYLRVRYEEEWKRQKKYPTLRGYIFSQLYAL